MKSKTIKSILRKKHQSLIDSIEFQDIKNIFKNNSLITGGCIPSMLQGETPSDFDVYFKDKESAKLVAEYYLEKFKKDPPKSLQNSDALSKAEVVDKDDRIKIMIKSAGVAGEGSEETYQYFEQVTDPSSSQSYVDEAAQAQGIEVEGQEQESNSSENKPKYRPVFLSSNAITLKKDFQLIIRFYGEPEEIHENYDYVHCTCSWDPKTGKLNLPPEALESILTRDLQYMGGSKYPLCSLIRTRKFISRGWTINAGQYVKMAWDLNKLDLSDPNVLEDQMVGVDAAYFTEVMRILRKENPKQIDGAYLMQVIDKIF